MLCQGFTQFPFTSEELYEIIFHALEGWEIWENWIQPILNLIYNFVNSYLSTMDMHTLYSVINSILLPGLV